MGRIRQVPFRVPAVPPHRNGERMSVDVLSLLGILPSGTEIEIYEDKQVQGIDDIEFESECVFKAKVGYYMGKCNYLARNINIIRIPNGVVQIYIASE